MPGKLINKYGTTIIDDHVLASIAGLSTMECYGVVGMVARSSAGGLVELLRREQSSKGVRVHTNETKFPLSFM
jgi:uncharacterized alkaline shock family protein YloU